MRGVWSLHLYELDDQLTRPDADAGNVGIDDVSTINRCRQLAGFVLLALPLAAYAQQLRGTTGSASAVEFPDSRVLPLPTPPFSGYDPPERRGQYVRMASADDAA